MTPPLFLYALHSLLIALRCTFLHIQGLLVLRIGRWLYAEHVQMVGAAIR